MKAVLIFLILGVCGTGLTGAAEAFEKDVVKTTAGDLEITFIGHGSLMFKFGNKVIHVDPYSKLADYAKLPKADLIFLTHEHQDHLDPVALQQLTTAKTTVVLTEKFAEKVPGGIIMRNGDTRDVGGIAVEAVPAYNIMHKRDTGQPFHPKGTGNGYVLTFADKRLYIAGDTENIPEMGLLKRIDIAFLPMNLPYTMTPEMVADAARSFKPKVLYPYHYGEADPARLVALLKGNPEIEVRIRRMK
ncbi:MBL fold metallo-hydrolase [Geobacter pelophilus]|uniref:MBL fold metallo-hydrolase n=2 Tax=Geoanaerobacter pelophilus TaxID=60036 RepID=A0AAW4LAH7_9BACT|nr:MBL fold metallo-hydrolase [Geoanaerobacter pelophilus]